MALDFVRWVDRVIANGTVTGRHAVKLDSLSTSIVLNIAEGNGRFSPSDHRNFIDIAPEEKIHGVDHDCDDDRDDESKPSQA